MTVRESFTRICSTRSKYYVEELSRLFQRIRRVSPQFQERGSRLLLHDNARPNTAVSVGQVLEKQGIPELFTTPPYSSELSPSDYFIFPKIKSSVKGRRFRDTEDIKRNVTKELLALHADEFENCFQQIYERAQNYVIS
jgi:transposase